MRPRNPLVVIDWNFLQTLQRGHDVPPGFDCLLQDANLHELFAKQRPERSQLARKFGGWVSRNVNRVWFSRHFEDLSRMQADPLNPRRIRQSDLVYTSYTHKLRSAGAMTNMDWTKLLKDEGKGKALKEYAEGRARFVHFGDGFCKWINEAPASRRKTLPIQPDDLKRWIQDPMLVVDFVMSPYAPDRFSDPRWRARLIGFPDRLVIARWARITGYYAMLRACGATRKFENNWDDALYGMLASFTGHLATTDGGLVKMVKLIFPGVRIIG